MRIIIGMVIGTVSILILGLVIMLQFGKSHVADLSKQRAASSLIELQKSQERLGVLCVDGDKVISSYIDATVPFVEEQKHGTQPTSPQKIIELGEHVSEVMNTCDLHRRMLEENNNHMLSNFAFSKDEVREEILIVRAAIARSQATWCKNDCVRDAAARIEESTSNLRLKL